MSKAETESIKRNLRQIPPAQKRCINQIFGYVALRTVPTSTLQIAAKAKMPFTRRLAADQKCFIY